MSGYDDNRAWRHLYKRVGWERLRRDQLESNPFCCFCAESTPLGEMPTVAEVVDHKTPHKGDERLFFDPNNLQSLCKLCHDSRKQKMEKGKKVMAFGPGGEPLGFR